jgi:hypothetical protein
MQTLTLFSKLILFLTSYIPLGIICLIIDFEKFEFPFFKHEVCTVLLAPLIILLLPLLYLLIHHYKTKPAGREKMNIIKVENMDSQLLSYIFTYIVPFLGFPSERRIYVALFLLFIIGVLYIRSEMIGINPILALFGYHIVKVEWKKDSWEQEQSQTAMLITRLDYYKIKHSKNVNAIQMHNELYLLRGNNND